MAKARKSWHEIAKIWLIRARFPSARPYPPNRSDGSTRSGPTSGNPMMGNVRGDTWAQKNNACCVSLADPAAVDTLDKRDVSPEMSRLEDMQNALNGCGFCAGCRIHVHFPFGGQLSLH